MLIFGCILNYILLIIESVLIANHVCDPGTETYVFIGLSCILGLLAVGMASASENIFSFIGKMILSLILVPIITALIMIPFEILIKMFGTFGFKGTVGIGVLIAIAIVILSSCVFIFFF